MFPGKITRITEEVVASADTISVRADLVRISGSTQIETIVPNPKLTWTTGGIVIGVVATDGAVVVGTSGNVLVGQTLAQNRLYILMYSSVAGKWYIHGVA